MDDEQDRFHQAAAHARWCQKQGGITDTSSRELCEVRDGVVILRNVHGPMARYRVSRDGRLWRAAGQRNWA